MRAVLGVSVSVELPTENLIGPFGTGTDTTVQPKESLPFGALERELRG